MALDKDQMLLKQMLTEMVNDLSIEHQQAIKTAVDEIVKICNSLDDVVGIAAISLAQLKYVDSVS